MGLPDNVRYLLEALRGGGTSTYKGGKMTDHSYGPSRPFPKGESSGKMPKNMALFHAARQEAVAMGGDPPTYAEWMANK